MALRPAPPLPCDLGWERWQGSRLSKRLLSDQSRQEGHSVVRVPRALRTAFLEMATIFILFDAGFHRRHRVLSAEQLAAFVAWSNATRALLDALRKEPHD